MGAAVGVGMGVGVGVGVAASVAGCANSADAMGVAVLMGSVVATETDPQPTSVAPITTSTPTLPDIP